MCLKLQDLDHTELPMLTVMKYPIPGTSSTCADFILDPSYMVMSVDLFNKSRVSMNRLTTFKGSFQPGSIILDFSLIGFSNQGNLHRFIPAWIT